MLGHTGAESVVTFESTPADGRTYEARVKAQGNTAALLTADALVGEAITCTLTPEQMTTLGAGVFTVTLVSSDGTTDRYEENVMLVVETLTASVT